MTGAQFRMLIEQHSDYTVNGFQEAVIADYLSLHGRAKESSARRNVKRWFAVEKAEEEVLPRRLYRDSINRVLGYDVFEVWTPHEIQLHLQSLEVAADGAREALIGVLEGLAEHGVQVRLGQAAAEFLATPPQPARRPR